MTVAELREQLKDVDDSFLVVQASDEEGNSFSPTNELTTERYDDDAQEIDRGHSNNSVVLWPSR